MKSQCDIIFSKVSPNVADLILRAVIDRPYGKDQRQDNCRKTLFHVVASPIFFQQCSPQGVWTPFAPCGHSCRDNKSGAGYHIPTPPKLRTRLSFPLYISGKAGKIGSGRSKFLLCGSLHLLHRGGGGLGPSFALPVASMPRNLIVSQLFVRLQGGFRQGLRGIRKLCSARPRGRRAPGPPS